MAHRHPLRPAARACSAAVLAAAAAACAASPPPSPDVSVHGSLRAMFHQDQTSAAVTLDELGGGDGLVAVGALAELAGEVTVVHGRAYLSYPEGPDGVRTEVAPAAGAGAGAALLVAAEVQEWRAVTTDRAIPFGELDEAVAALAAAAGLDTRGAFPFLVEGEVAELEWHVIDGRRLAGGGRTHRDHLEASVRRQAARARVTLVGFYSRGHQGVFTHAGSATHVHCVVYEPLSAGHVDHVVLPAGTAVMFPEPGRG